MTNYEQEMINVLEQLNDSMIKILSTTYGRYLFSLFSSCLHDW
jgi:hypothetical protein